MNPSSKSEKSARILLVDDDAQGLEAARKILEFAQYQVTTASDGQMALDLMRTSTERIAERFDVVVTDVRMPRLGGLEFLRALSLLGESTPVILMTAFGRVEDAVWAMKLGAVDFLSKPFKRQMLLAAVEAALKRSRARGSSDRAVENGVGASSGGGSRQSDERLIGGSNAMQSLRSQIARIAPTSATVLIQGESGTGKELVARSIHERSPRKASGRFIALNCAAVPEQLIESELFGFEKGAFTGATSMREGLFEAANGGTLLLDEIGDMPLALQAKLLRVLQEGEVRRIGATLSRKVDVRVLAATHRDLRENVRLGAFREDLLFRLEVISLRVPPLRERLDDLPVLAAFFLSDSGRRHGKAVTAISPDAMGVLASHRWPGNVRELSNVIERAVVFSNSETLGRSELPPHLISVAELNGPTAPVGSMIEVRLGTPLREVEDLMIRRTLEATDGDKNMTAKLLGINSRTIYRKLGEGRRDEPPAPEEQDL